MISRDPWMSVGTLWCWPSFCRLLLSGIYREEPFLHALSTLFNQLQLDTNNSTLISTAFGQHKLMSYRREFHLTRMSHYITHHCQSTSLSLLKFPGASFPTLSRIPRFRDLPGSLCFLRGSLTSSCYCDTIVSVTICCFRI